MTGGRPLRVEWAETDTVAALARAYHAAPDGHAARRVQALWSLRQGHGIRATAQRLGLSERSIQLWLRWYRTDGLQAVAAARHGRAPGRQGWLTAPQREALRTHRGTGAVRTAWDARDWLSAQFGVPYRRKGVYGVLKRLRAHPKAPPPSNPKSSAAVQEAWKKGGAPTPSARRASPSRPG